MAFFYYYSTCGTNYQGGERGDGEAEEGWHGVPDVEVEGVP